MEIKFPRDTAFRKTFFVPDSFAHPAKMDAQLLIWIVERYTEAGEIILDPMAGSGTLMLACTLGRHCVLVELEEKFCKMMRDNWEQVKMRPQLGSAMGECQILQGDARQLEGLCDKIITSPPYAEAKPGTMTEEQWAENRLRHHRSPDCEGRAITSGYPDNPNNLGNLPYGEINHIITSPPYEGSVSASTGGERDQSSARQREKRLEDKGYDPAKYQGGVGRNLEVDFQYSKAEDNIGNLKNTSYLSAMAQVYQQCYSVLKPEGLMILVTKNFLRDQKEIRLDTDTLALCDKAGFQFVERHYRRLPSQSFWRVIYARKYPNAPVLDREDILVFRKEKQ